MTITLPPKLEKLVQERLRSGRYASASEVVMEALEFLERHERVRAEQRAELEAELVEGARELRRGEKIDGEQAYRQLKERMEAHR